MSDKEPKRKILTTINIKTIFLITLTTLVIINTCTLAYLVPIVGFHIMPDNQAAVEMWKTVTAIMSICTSLIIACGIIYVTTKVINKIK